MIVDRDERHHYSHLMRAAVGMSVLLRARDKSPQGHVGLFLPNVFAFPVSYFGAQLAGKVPVPINVMLQPKEVAFILNDAGIHTVLTISLFKPLFDALAGALPWEVTAVYLDQLEQPPGDLQPPPAHELVAHETPDALACLMYTSGTTGNPKGVMLSYGNLEANAIGCEKVLELHDYQDTVMALLPLFHSYGMMATMICPIFAQVPVVTVPRFQPGQVLQTLQSEKISALFLVAPMYGLLCRHPKLRETDLSAIRICVSGGGPLPPNIEMGWKKLTGNVILNGFGLTEASPVVANNAPEARKPGSIGRALHNVQVEIRDANGKALGVGEEGEITVNAPSVMKGYHNRPDETEEALTPDGWLRTGDLGKVDEDGFLYITGRAKELIIFGGENIMPLEIENALTLHPAVMEAAVVGMPDESKGEVPVAAIVLQEGQEVKPAALREFLKDKIAPFKIPRDFHFVEALPKNTLNKVLKNQLREQLAAAD